MWNPLELEIGEAVKAPKMGAGKLAQVPWERSK